MPDWDDTDVSGEKRVKGGLEEGEGGEGGVDIEEAEDGPDMDEEE